MAGRSFSTLWSDELARQATVSLETGTAEDTYGPDRLVDDNPARLFKAIETTVAVEFSYPAKQPLAIVALIHSTLESSDDVRLQGCDDGIWTAPAFDQVISPSDWVGSGVTRWPVNTWLEPDENFGYDPLGFKFYRLAFGLTTPLAQPLQLGQVRFHPTIGTFSLDRDVEESRSKPRIDNRTAFGVSTIYTRGTTIWKDAFTLSALFDVDNERQILQAHWSDVDGANRPWLFVPDEDDQACYLVRWASTDEQIRRVVSGVSNRVGGVEEVGRGLRPGV